MTLHRELAAPAVTAGGQDIEGGRLPQLAAGDYDRACARMEAVVRTLEAARRPRALLEARVLYARSLGHRGQDHRRETGPHSRRGDLRRVRSAPPAGRRRRAIRRLQRQRSRPARSSG